GGGAMSNIPIRAADLDELLKPPTDTEVDTALARFAVAARKHYGERLKGLYLFGSRARGDHRPDSDADVAVVLEDGDWVSWKERWLLNRLAYDPSLESGVVIQPWPFSRLQWNAQYSAPSTALLASARREAIPIRTP